MATGPVPPPASYTALLAPSRLSGALKAPPSKSAAHRMLLCAALAPGASEVRGLELSADMEATLRGVRALGARCRLAGSTARIQGMGGRFAPAPGPVDCGESGSTLRFLIPLLGLAPGETLFTGAPRLFARPLAPYQSLFQSQGLGFSLSAASLRIAGPLKSPAPPVFSLPGDVSSQFVTGLLLAMPFLPGSAIRLAPPVESRSYIEITRHIQALFGVESRWQEENLLTLAPGAAYAPYSGAVEGDWSQAAVGAVLGAVAGGLTLPSIDNSPQGDRVILDIVKRCGAAFTQGREGIAFPGTPAPLRAPGDIDLSDCPDLGPILCTLAVFCPGRTRLVNAGRLRLKESDRISCTAAEFRKLGARIQEGPDYLDIEGGHPLHGAEVDSHNDHRLVMALAAAALGAGLPLTIRDAGAVAKSWPSFFDALRGIGAKVELKEN